MKVLLFLFVSLTSLGKAVCQETFTDEEDSGNTESTGSGDIWTIVLIVLFVLVAILLMIWRCYSCYWWAAQQPAVIVINKQGGTMQRGYVRLAATCPAPTV